MADRGDDHPEPMTLNEATAGRLLRSAVRITNAPYGWLVTRHDGRDQVIAAHGLDAQALNIAGTITDRALTGPLPAWVENDPQALPAAATGARSCLAVPLVVGARTIGALAVADTEPRDWQGDAITALTDLAGLVTRRLGDTPSTDSATTTQGDDGDTLEGWVTVLPVIAWSATAEGLVDFANQAFFDYTGLGPVDLAAGAWLEVVHPGDRERVAQVWTDASRSASTYDVEFRIRRSDGAYRWHLVTARPTVNEAGEVRRWYGAAMDVHDRIEAETALRSSEEHLRSLLALVPVGIWDEDWSGMLALMERWRNQGVQDLRQHLTDHPERVREALRHIDVRQVNEASVRMLEAKDAAELVSVLPALLCDPQRPDEPPVAFIDKLVALFDGKRELHLRPRLRTLRGRSLPVVLSVRFPEPNSDSARVLLSFMDVSEQERLQRQLAQAERLKAIGTLTGGVAHDFNNLLTVLLGNLDALSDRVPSDVAPLIAKANGAAERAAELTRRLLTFAHRSPLHPVAVDVPRLLRNLLGMLDTTLGETVHVVADLPDDLPDAIVDAAELERAIMNLCLNARDAMPAGGTLTVRCALHPPGEPLPHGSEPEADTRLERQRGYLRVVVQDDGSGMDEATAAQAFEPYFTTKRKETGGGLGLSVVHGFARQSGGTVAIASAPGRGTEVSLWLPLAERAARSALAGSRDRPADAFGMDARRGPDTVRTQAPTILVVEDDDLVRDAVLAQLEALGYRVHEARNGSDAVRTLASDLPLDLVFTDVVMPGELDGRAVADEAQRLRPGIPIIFTTGYAQHVALDLPGTRCLQKPYGRVQLAQIVREALRHAPDGNP